jgi:hypothetical protein
MQIEITVARLRELRCELLLATRETEIAELEHRWGRRLPGVYRALLVGYKFSPVVIGEIELFGNGCDDAYEGVASVRDPNLMAWRAPRGAVQIGRPATGAYDPVCLEAVGA